MDILFYLGRFPVVSETFVLRQIASMIESGHAVYVYAEEVGDLQLLEQWPIIKANAQFAFPHCAASCGLIVNAEVPYLPAAIRKRGLSSVITWMWNRRRLRGLKTSFSNARNSFDVVVAHFGHVAVRACLARDAGLINGKLCAVFHGADLTAKFATSHRMRIAYRYLFDSAERLFPISHRWRYHLIDMGARKERTYVTRMGVPLRQFEYRERSEEQTNVFAIASVGRLVEKKGFDYAIKAVKLLKDRGISIKYHLVGDGPMMNELVDMVRTLGLGNEVELHGSLYGPSVIELIRQAGALITPSVIAANGDEEGLPVVLMEAMALGTPVVASSHSGIPELVSHLHTGLLVPEKSVHDLADAVERLMNDRTLCRALRAKGRRAIELDFDSDKNGKVFERLLLDVIAASTSGGRTA